MVSALAAGEMNEQNGFLSLCDSLDADDNGRKERK